MDSCNAVFDRKEFEDAISKAKNTTESKSILPILSNFLIEIAPTTYTLKATDLENYISIKGRPEQAEVGCTLCINSKKLGDIVKNLSSATLNLSLINDSATGSSYIQIQSGRSKFKLTLSEASEFPAFPEIEEQMTKNTMIGSMLMEGLERTEYATAKDDSLNPAITGVNVSIEQDSQKPLVEFAATDGSRLTVFRKHYSLEDIENAYAQCSFTIPKKTIKILKSITNKASFVNIHYKEGNSFLVFEDKDNWTLFSRLLEGQFPDYKIYIDGTERHFQAKIQKKELKDLIRRLSFSSEGNVIPIKLTFGDNILIGESSDRELTEGRDEIDIDYLGETFSVELNAKYLKEAIDYAPNEEYIFISTNDPANGLLVHCKDSQGDSYYYASLIMPFG
jgi:DNA polymerase-3 subunit beta